MGKGSAAPDPYQTSTAQQNANTQAIKTSAKYSAIDQFGPGGSTTYQRDSEGVPTSQTVTLSPGEQGVFNANQATRGTLASTAQNYASSLPGSAFTMPDNARADQVEGALYNRRLAMVQPGLDEADAKARLSLTERGIPIGSEIYNQEMDRLARNRSDTLTNIANDATLAGGQESDRLLQQAITARNQPYNELSALMSGSSGGQIPTFQNTPSYSANAPDVAGNVYKSYQANQANNNSFNTGLFGLISGLGSALISDRRAKTDIRRVGTTDAGLGVYTYRYTTGGPVQMGVMAQEVEEVFPDAVVTVGGIKAVNYAMIG